MGFLCSTCNFQITFNISFPDFEISFETHTNLTITLWLEFVLYQKHIHLHHGFVLKSKYVFTKICLWLLRKLKKMIPEMNLVSDNIIA